MALKCLRALTAMEELLKTNSKRTLLAFSPGHILMKPACLRFSLALGQGL